MSTKRQHFVPKVYLKAWETDVETEKEPSKLFRGVYVFNGKETSGNGANRSSVLWNPHLYTIDYDNYLLLERCPQISRFFVNQIYDILRHKQVKPVYAKNNYCIIKTIQSIRKHINTINEWEFFYDDGNLARRDSLIAQIHSIKCYLLEEGFDSQYEKYWEDVYQKFVYEVQTGAYVTFGRSEKLISVEAAVDMLNFFIMMLCRNPDFLETSLYGKSAFFLTDLLMRDIPDMKDVMRESLWYSVLYNMMFRKKGYASELLKSIEKNCQMVLFEAKENNGAFITSDRPAFLFLSLVLRENMNGMIFPISPTHLLFIARGNAPFNIVDYRSADYDTIKFFNQAIIQNKQNIVIASTKTLI